MARLLRRFLHTVDPCSYLPDRASNLDTRLMVGVTVEEFERLLVRGWRRFGPAYFRPSCGPCRECVSLRVPVETLALSKSQRRALKGVRGMRVELGVPRVDEARIALYRKWHADREVERGWAPTTLDAESYQMEFAMPHPAAREVSFYDDSDEGGGKLIGVGICDVTPRCWSAVYFYFDPEYARHSMGVVNVLVQCDLAHARGVPHVYLGFRVEGCASLKYKAAYQPHELLVNYPGDDEEPLWVPGSSRG
jgi:arginyl-tRNA--protein-N-Asp/Glu arginylyltransferase